MDQPIIFQAGATDAVKYAGKILRGKGYSIRDTPSPDTTLTLLDIPSLDSFGKLRNGDSPEAVLDTLPRSCTIMGGNLDHPIFAQRTTVDLLKNETYLKENAKITAYCALKILFGILPVTIENLPILLIGWGRIGKTLAPLLKNLNADVTVATSNPQKTNEITAAGLSAADTCRISPELYRVIMNTAPAPLLELSKYPQIVKIDLASVKGLEGPDVIWARGLPGIHAPESSGALIAHFVIEQIKECSK